MAAVFCDSIAVKNFFFCKNWAKVMKTIIDEYRDISANFNEILFETKYHAIFWDIYVPVVARFHQVVSDISSPLSEISFRLSDKSAWRLPGDKSPWSLQTQTDLQQFSLSQFLLEKNVLLEQQQ